MTAQRKTNGDTAAFVRRHIGPSPRDIADAVKVAVPEAELKATEATDDRARAVAHLEAAREWERAAHGAAAYGMRVVNIRTGLVLSPTGGLLKPQLPLLEAGLSGPLGGGKQWQSWIGLDDMAGAVAHLALTEDAEGPFNVAAPQPVRQKQFAKTVAGVLHRPAVVPTPLAGPKAHRH